MRRIIRRNLVRDANGHPLSLQSQRVTDDGTGSVQYTSEMTAQNCSGCGRPVTDLSELRGVCDWCHTRGCCVHCLTRCQVCSRRLCGRCRCGFAGSPALTVCPVCRNRLVHRQMLQDEQAAFAQEVMRHRLFTQDQALRLAFERNYVSAQLQAARLGLRWGKPRFLRRLWKTATEVAHHARRALR
jgi:hypothetical protein